MKKLIITIVLVAVGAFVVWTFEPLLKDDVVNEEIKISNRDILPAASNPTSEVKEGKEIEISDQKKSPDVSEISPPEDGKTEKLYSGNFVDADPGHRASGQVYVQGTDLSIVDLNSTNVPDGFVYLATDDTASDFISIGKLKGNIGNQNYSVPEGVDLEKYDTVLVWCRAFSVLVGSAKIK